MHLPAISCFWFAACLLLASAASAANLTMGVENLSYLPYYSMQDNTYQGFARELFDAFANERGHHIEYRPLPVERLYRSLLDGSIDLKFPDNPTWRRELKTEHAMHYSDTVAPFVDGVMVVAGRASALPTPPRIGTIRGFTPWPLLDDIAQGRVTLTENNSISGLLRQTIAGRLDGAYINVAVAHFHLKNSLHQDAALTLDERLPNTRSAYFVSTIRQSMIIEVLNKWLQENAPRIRALQQQWGIDP